MMLFVVVGVVFFGENDAPSIVLVVVVVFLEKIMQHRCFWLLKNDAALMFLVVVVFLSLHIFFF